LKQEKQIQVKRIQPIDAKRVREAGDERVAPGTPVALLKTRIQGAMASLNKLKMLLPQKIFRMRRNRFLWRTSKETRRSCNARANIWN